MGAVLSKLDLSRFDTERIIKIWIKSSYFRVAIAMIIFLVTRRIYNKCHRLYYNLPLNGPTGLPLIGCIPYLLVNTYKFMQNMSEYGEIASFNTGLQTVCCINNMRIAREIVLQQQQAEEEGDAARNNEACVAVIDNHDVHQLNDMIREQLNSEFLTKCIKPYILGSDLNEICLRKDLKCMILNAMMSACFGVTLDATQMNENLYEKWDIARQKYIKKQSISSLAFDGALFGMMITKLFGAAARHEDKEKDYYEIWRDIFGQYIEGHIDNVNTDCIWYKMRIKEEEYKMCDLFTITAHSMDSTASSLEWSIISLCKFSALQDKISEEIYSACDANLENINLANDEYQAKCGVLKSFIADILRLHPFGSLPRFRCNSSPKAIIIQMNDGKTVRVPPGGLYHINLYGMKAGGDHDANQLHLDTAAFDGFVPRNAVEKAFKIRALILILSLLLFKYKFDFKHAQHEKDEMNVVIFRERERAKQAKNEENYGEMEEDIAPQKGVKIVQNSQVKNHQDAIKKLKYEIEPIKVAIPFEIEALPESEPLAVVDLNADRKNKEKESDHENVQEEKQMTPTPRTPRGKRRICDYYGSAAGCTNGDKCYWSHDEPNRIPQCKDYDMQTMTGCRWGKKCKFRHEVHIEKSTKYRGMTEKERGDALIQKIINDRKMMMGDHVDHVVIS